MDEVLFSWAMLLVLFAWRWICKVQRVQTAIHLVARKTCPLLAWLIQWYTLLQIGLGYLILRTFADVVHFEYRAMSYLDPSEVANSVRQIRTYPNGPPLDEDAQNDLEIPSFLRWFSLGAPIAGLLAYMVVLVQMTVVARKGAHLKRQYQSCREWRATKRQNMVMIVLCLPAVFIAMSMRSQIRIWSVMTGTSWSLFRRHHPRSNATWDSIATSEISTCEEDLSLANFFQLQAIGAFGLLTISYLKDAPRKYRKILASAGLLGLWCYLGISSIIFMVDLYSSVLASYEKTEMLDGAGAHRVPSFMQRFLSNASWSSQDIQDNFLGPIQPMNLVFTLLCVGNMLVYERMEEIEMHLGEATLKFNATKLLLILTHGQPLVIDHITRIDFFTRHIFHYTPAGSTTSIPWHPSEPAKMLIHTSLLVYECLLVVILNGVCWGFTFNTMDHKFFGYFPDEKSEGLLGKTSFRAAPPPVECMSSSGDWVDVTVKSLTGDERLDPTSLREHKEKAPPANAGSFIRRIFYDENDTDESEDEHGDLTQAHRDKEIMRTAFPQKPYMKPNVHYDYPAEGLKPGDRTISTDGWESDEA